MKELSTKDRELSRRERAVSDFEKAIKEETDRRRAEEQTAHRNLMQEAEQYKEEQRNLVKTQKAEISKKTEEYKKSIEKLKNAEYGAFKTATTGYIIFLTVFLFGLSVFSIIRQKVFCTDFVNFFRSVPRQVMAGAKKISDLIPFESDVIQWIVLIMVIVLIIVLVCMLYTGARENVSALYMSFMAFLLALMVFFGEEIKPIIKGFNLFGTWLVTFGGSITAWIVFVKIREMKDGVIQDWEKNVILFVGLILFGAFVFSMVL